MNTTATSFSSEHSTWCTPSGSRRSSTESILSIQGKETDFVCDTTDTDSCDSERDVEYEPVTDDEEAAPISSESSGPSEDEIITTKVVTVSVREDVNISADAESSVDLDSTDSELDLHDYWQCVRCRADNNNPLYRYCQKCYQVRKNFFPPRPKRKRKQPTIVPESVNVTKLVGHVDSGIDSGFSQELSQEINNSQTLTPGTSQTDVSDDKRHLAAKRRRFRKCKSDLLNGNQSVNDVTDSETDEDIPNKRVKIQPLVKTVSDPQITIQSDSKQKLTKKALVNSIKEKLDSRENLCIMCFSEPKSSAFVHGGVGHICCCYKCAVKVWAKTQRCPLCNCKVSNVIKTVIW